MSTKKKIIELDESKEIEKLVYNGSSRKTSPKK